jgi:flagellar basal body rod protein FlgB
MNLPILITDNITELLIKIIKFTQMRQRVLTENIDNFDRPGFVPKDLMAEEFSDLLNDALNEHIQNRRLVLRDTENIKFGVNGNFEVRPIEDKDAKRLLTENPEEYLELQLNKLFENSINERMTKELLKQKEGLIPILE